MDPSPDTTLWLMLGLSLLSNLALAASALVWQWRAGAYKERLDLQDNIALKALEKVDEMTKERDTAKRLCGTLSKALAGTGLAPPDSLVPPANLQYNRQGPAGEA